MTEVFSSALKVLLFSFIAGLGVIGLMQTFKKLLPRCLLRDRPLAIISLALCLAGAVSAWHTVLRELGTWYIYTVFGAVVAFSQLGYEGYKPFMEAFRERICVWKKDGAP